jgi:hypothetical protein
MVVGFFGFALLADPSHFAGKTKHKMSSSHGFDLVQPSFASNGHGNGNGGGNGQGNSGGNGNSAGGGNASGGNGKAKGKSTSDVSQDTNATGATALNVLGGDIVTSRPGDRFMAEEILVIDGRAEVTNIAERLGFRLIETRQLSSLQLSALRFATPPRVDARQAIDLLRKAAPNLIADVDTTYAAYAPQSAQVISLPAPDYARHLIGWLGGDGCGAGFRVGMIDTAIEPASPLFHSNRLHRKSFIAPQADRPGPDHGTAVAMLLTGGRDPARSQTEGLLPAADLYAADVFERDGREIRATAFAMAAALDWMVAEHVPLVNASLSGGPNLLLQAAIRRAAERGTILVAAAGNDGPAALPAYPAAYPDAIAITAVDQDKQVFADANQGSYIAFAAPGVRIWAADGIGAGKFLTGTSFAAPFATAVSATELMAGVPANPTSLREALAGDAVHLGLPGRNSIYGFGLVHARGACGADISAAQ